MTFGECGYSTFISQTSCFTEFYNLVFMTKIPSAMDFQHKAIDHYNIVRNGSTIEKIKFKIMNVQTYSLVPLFFSDSKTADFLLLECMGTMLHYLWGL